MAAEHVSRRGDVAHLQAEGGDAMGREAPAQAHQHVLGGVPTQHHSSRIGREGPVRGRCKKAADNIVDTLVICHEREKGLEKKTKTSRVHERARKGSFEDVVKSTDRPSRGESRRCVPSGAATWHCSASKEPDETTIVTAYTCSYL